MGPLSQQDLRAQFMDITIHLQSVVDKLDADGAGRHENLCRNMGQLQQRIAAAEAKEAARLTEPGVSSHAPSWVEGLHEEMRQLGERVECMVVSHAEGLKEQGKSLLYLNDKLKRAESHSAQRHKDLQSEVENALAEGLCPDEVRAGRLLLLQRITDLEKTALATAELLDSSEVSRAKLTADLLLVRTGLGDGGLSGAAARVLSMDDCLTFANANSMAFYPGIRFDAKGATIVWRTPDAEYDEWWAARQPVPEQGEPQQEPASEQNSEAQGGGLAGREGLQVGKRFREVSGSIEKSVARGNPAVIPRIETPPLTLSLAGDVVEVHPDAPPGEERLQGRSPEPSADEAHEDSLF